MNRYFQACFGEEAASCSPVMSATAASVGKESEPATVADLMQLVYDYADAYHEVQCSMDEGNHKLTKELKAIQIGIGKEIKTKLEAATAPPQAKPCIWTPVDSIWMPDVYDSACGEVWSFEDGGPEENNVRYCQGCGGRVELKGEK